MVGDCAPVVAARVHVGPNHAGDSRVGARINRGSRRTGWLRFEFYRSSDGGGFWQD